MLQRLSEDIRRSSEKGPERESPSPTRIFLHGPPRTIPWRPQGLSTTGHFCDFSHSDFDTGGRQAGVPKDLEQSLVMAFIFWSFLGDTLTPRKAC
jgi:hypothetical protein